MAKLGQKQQGKHETHARIVDACSRLIRKEGIKSAAIAKVMQEAGMTVGGFYAHFDSKEDMVAEGFRRAVQQSGENSRGRLPAELSAVQKQRIFLQAYLSREHRDRDLQGEGCALAALAAEMGKGSPALRKVFAAECQKLTFESTALFSDDKTRLGRKDFLATLSTYMGGLILARATRGSPLSEEILGACLDRLGASRMEKPPAPEAA